MDLFKAIFENSEPSSSSSSEASDEEDKQEMDTGSRTADRLNTAVDETRTDTASETISAAVLDTTALTLQLPTQQEAEGI